MQNINVFKSALTFFGSIVLFSLPNAVLAGELSINDIEGTTLLRLEAPENNTFDIRVDFNSIDSSKESHISLKGKNGLSRDVLVGQDAISSGVLISTLPVGVYSLTSSSKNVEIKKVSIVSELKDCESSNSDSSAKDENISSYTLGGGALAAVAAAAAVTVGGGVDSLSGDGSNNTNSSREGRLNTNSIVTVDPNRPNTVLPISNAPAVVIAPAPVVGTSTTGSNNAEAAPTAIPSVAPAPPITAPMTPS